MLSSRRVQLLAALFVAAALSVVFSTAEAQAPAAGEKVRFTTVDGVDLQGMFYSGKRTGPTVLMLHSLGEDSRKKAWVELAEKLNKEGIAVLTFDFRGHGQSTTVDPALFWKFPRNIASVRGAAKKGESIEFKDMGKDYFPCLVNDIAAAKAFLDNRNDTGACNTSSLIVIGAETGATLGAIWLNAEWHRYVFTPRTLTTLETIAKTPEGKDTIAGIWLSATSKLGSRTVSLSSVLDVAGRENATPMFFLFSEEDGTAKTIAKACETKFKGSKKKDDKYRFTVAMPVPAGKLAGAALLQASLPTEEKIIAYVKDVGEAKSNEWSERDFRKTLYVWRPAGGRPIPAKLLPNEKLLAFDTYEMFVR
jgi:pimeloyl-ACP methyl ester carboxylesterase